MESLLYHVKKSVLITLLTILSACSQYETGQQVWINIQGDDPGSVGFAHGRIISINGDLAEIKIRKFKNIPKEHELSDLISTTEPLYINLDKLTTYEIGKEKYDAFSSLNNKTELLVKKMLRSLKRLSDVKSNKLNSTYSERLTMLEKQALNNDFIAYAKSLRLLNSALEIFPNKLSDITTYEKWQSEYQPILDSLIKEMSAVSGSSLSERFLAISLQHQDNLKGIIANDSSDNENAYIDSLVIAFNLLQAPAASKLQLTFDDVHWGEYASAKRDYVKINEQVNTFRDNVLLENANAYQKNTLEYIQNREQKYIDKLDDKWSRKVKRSLLETVDVSKFVTESEAEIAFNELKKKVASIEETLDFSILTPDDFDDTFLAAVERNASQKEFLQEQQQEHFASTQKLLLANLATDELYSEAAADLAFQDLLLKAEAEQQNFQEPLITSEHKAQLYHAVEKNQPNRQRATLTLQQRFIQQANRYKPITETDVKKVMQRLHEDIEHSVKHTGLVVDKAAIEAELMAQMSANQLADRKKNLFINNNKWFVRFSDRNEKSGYRNNLMETELFCVLDFTSDTKGRMRCPVTPKGSSIVYDALWEVEVNYVPQTARVNFSIKKLIDGPRGTPKYAANNPGKALAETDFQKVEGQIQSSSFNSFQRYEMSLSPFIKSPTVEEFIADKPASPKTVAKILIAKSSKHKVEAFAMGNSQNWCKPDIQVELKSQNGTFYENGQVGTFIKKLGTVIERQCEQAVSAKVIGKAEGARVLYRASADKSKRWNATSSTAE